MRFNRLMVTAHRNEVCFPVLACWCFTFSIFGISVTYAASAFLFHSRLQGPSGALFCRGGPVLRREMRKADRNSRPFFPCCLAPGFPWVPPVPLVCRACLFLGTQDGKRQMALSAMCQGLTKSPRLCVSANGDEVSFKCARLSCMTYGFM